MDLIEEFVDFKFYRMPPYPVKCLIKEGVSKSGSGDQGISHWKWNLRYPKFCGGFIEEAAKDKI